MRNAAPRVFQEGTVTIVLSPDGVRAYVGANEVPTMSRVEAAASDEGVQVRMTVDESEEDLRLVRSVPWIQSAVRRPGPSSF